MLSVANTGESIIDAPAGAICISHPISGEVKNRWYWSWLQIGGFLLDQSPISIKLHFGHIITIKKVITTNTCTFIDGWVCSFYGYYPSFEKFVIFQREPVKMHIFQFIVTVCTTRGYTINTCWRTMILLLECVTRHLVVAFTAAGTGSNQINDVTLHSRHARSSMADTKAINTDGAGFLNGYLK